MQSFLIVLSTRIIKAYKGVWEAAFATFIMASSFLIINIIPQSIRNLKIFLDRFLFICSFALIYLAICRFAGKKIKKWILFGIFPISLLALILTLLSRSNIIPFKLISVSTSFVLTGSTALTLWKSNTKRYKLSAIITTLTLAAFSIIMLRYFVIGITSVEVLIPLGSTEERIFSLSFFTVSFLWTGGFILMISQRLQSDLNDLAMNDALTRIRNRRAMDQLLDFEMQRAEKEVKDFSIVLIDIDHFKLVNDNYGHEIGDETLHWFASKLQTNLRVQDIVARWGGEEFLILLPDTSLVEAEQIAERLREIIERSVLETSEGNIQITFSAGISSSKTNRDVKELCKVADQALYYAKKTRNRVITQDKIPDFDS